MKILAPVLFLLACATTSAIAGDPPHPEHVARIRDEDRRAEVVAEEGPSKRATGRPGAVA